MIEAIRRVLMAALMLAIGVTISALCVDLGDLTGTPALYAPGILMGLIVGVFTGLRVGNMLFTGRYTAH